MGTNKKISKAEVPFTMVELLVVIAIISIIFMMLIPTLSRARETGRRTSCVNNLKQLTLGNSNYHHDFSRLVAFGTDYYTGGENLTRWHGKRDTASNSAEYDRLKSPLASFLGSSKKIICPTYEIIPDKSDLSTEKGGGGYGYNELIGTRKYDFVDPDSREARFEGLQLENISEPSKTIMFADSACKVDSAGDTVATGGTIADFSLLEAPHEVSNKVEQPTWDLTWPSMHFRHLRTGCVSWVDGHVTTDLIEWQNDLVDWGDKDLGWFGPQDNSYFDPF